MTILCPRCGSDQFTAQKKGFSFGRGVAGDLIGGPLFGALAGGAASRKILITCLECGKSWQPGAHVEKPPRNWSTPVHGDRSRTTSVALWIGIILMPYIFAWLTLRKGRSLDERLIAFGWLIFLIVASIAQRG